MKKIDVGVLGATGAVGQKFVERLSNHPWFRVAALAASEKSAGKKYGDAVNWLMPSRLPEYLHEMVVQNCLDDLEPKLLFSALDSSVADVIENRYQEKGYTIISNAKNHRFHEEVPLLIPEVNGSHIQLIKNPELGSIITVPNCSTVGLCLALKPLLPFGLEKVQVFTMQAISGAGYPGIASLDIMDNVIPFIDGEEEKMESEPRKIFGNLEEGKIAFHDVKISAHCNRVAVSDGHTASVSVKLTHKPSLSEILKAWSDFEGLDLPSAPKKPIIYHTNEKFPQPKRHRDLENGMPVHIGRLRECPLFDFKFTILSHNTIRGAAGGGILNAEWFVKTRNLIENYSLTPAADPLAYFLR